MNTQMVRRLARGLLAAALVASLAACDDATGPNSGRTVSLSLGLARGGANPAPGLFAQGLELTDGTNTLVIESAEVVIREIEFERVETAGCDSEVGDDDCEEFEIGPFLVALPLDGSVTKELEARIEPGLYDEIELDIHKPDDDNSADLDFIAQHPNFADVSIRVTGTYNGASFLYTTDLNEEQEIELASPLSVAEGSGPLNVTLTIDLATWFTNGAMMLIDPRTAVKGQPNENLVTDKIKNSIEGFRDDDRDGIPHDDDLDEDDS